MFKIFEVTQSILSENFEKNFITTMLININCVIYRNRLISESWQSFSIYKNVIWLRMSKK